MVGWQCKVMLCISSTHRQPAPSTCNAQWLHSHPQATPRIHKPWLQPNLKHRGLPSCHQGVHSNLQYNEHNDYAKPFTIQ